MSAQGIDISALTTGASITSVLGLAGFIIACVFIVFLVRTKSQRQKLELLPPSARARHLDDFLTRYGLSLKNISDEKKLELVLKEMNLRFRKQVGLATLGAIIFVVCFAIVALLPAPNSGNPSGERVKTESDTLVMTYQEQIESVRGDFEARHINPGTLERVRTNGKRLAELIGGVSDGKLNPSRRISKEEYGGWALLLVARTFPGPGQEQRRERVHYAKEAISRFNRAIAKMEEVKKAHSEGDRFAAQDYEWMIETEGPWNLTNYLKAMALAVCAEAGGDATPEQVRGQLAQVPEEYKARYPPQNVEELKWALDN